MKSTTVTRAVRLPDSLRIHRCRKAPEFGPGILFFTGGSALNDVSRAIKNYTYNSIHMVTPFDSGGSSKTLRLALDMPAIGDLRSRLMALADDTVIGHPEVFQLFNYRFPVSTSNDELRRQFELMIRGKDPLINAISHPMQRLIRNQMGYFFQAMPRDFDLRGANVGNLILSGGYLNNHFHLDPIIFLFSKLVEARGTVRAIVNDNLHLAAELQDGSRVIGQHLLTGKETAPLSSPIKRLRLCKNLETFSAASSTLSKRNRKLIERADLICFPPGSFYTSLVANLLPKGVGSAIASNSGPKVYIPNLGADPEQLGMDMNRSVTTLVDYLRADLGDDGKHKRQLDFVLIDSKRGDYDSQLSGGLMDKLGIQVLDTRLISEQSAPWYDPELLIAALLSLT